MKLRNGLKVLFATVAISLASSASAAFISTDWKTAGDGLVVTDESTGIEWLSLLVTDGASFNQTLARTQAGGDLEGWLLPTYENMYEMTSNFFPNSPVNKNAKFSVSAQEKASYFDLFGMTYGDRSAGFFTKENGTVSFAGVFSDNKHWGLNQASYSKDQAYPHYGTYLISNGGVSYSSISDPSLNANNPDAPPSEVGTVSVPEPATIAIFGLGLVGLICRRKGVTK